jgi:D-lactate dehydrogenase
MNRITPKCNGGAKSCYDVMHFEALGAEASHLEKETAAAIKRNELSSNLTCLITQESVQDYLKAHPETVLPSIITTKTHSVLPIGYISGKRKSIITRSAGYDHLEHLAETANIASLREYCVNAVAQTGMKFLYAAAGQLNQYTRETESFERKSTAAFMELGKHRTLTVFGVGKIGKRIYELAEANGLTVQGVDIREKELSAQYSGSELHFVSKEEAISTSDVIVNAMNLTRNRESRFFNVGYFNKEYMAQAKKGLIFINVTRGEIAPESVLLECYQSGIIAGIGLDVFSMESDFAKLLNGEQVGGIDLLAARTLVKMAIERCCNIYVQPHQGFHSDVAVRAKAVESIRHLSAWYANGGKCFNEQLPYYSNKRI